MADGLFTPIIDSFIATGTAIGLYIMNRHNKRIDGMEESIKHEHDDLAQFKLDAATLYARETALRRIYELLDQTAKASDIVELRNDIKNLIGQNGRH